MRITFKSVLRTKGGGWVESKSKFKKNDFETDNFDSREIHVKSLAKGNSSAVISEPFQS